MKISKITYGKNSFSVDISGASLPEILEPFYEIFPEAKGAKPIIFGNERVYLLQNSEGVVGKMKLVASIIILDGVSHFIRDVENQEVADLIKGLKENDKLYIKGLGQLVVACVGCTPLKSDAGLMNEQQIDIYCEKNEDLPPFW